jgi:metal-sulfur cluster biosynthetic enzyme
VSRFGRLAALSLCFLALPVAGATPHEGAPIADATLYLPAYHWDAVEMLSPEQSWGGGQWRFAKRLILVNDTDTDRVAEPVEVDVEFHATQITDLSREVRVVATDGGSAREQPSQICCAVIEDATIRARLFFLADIPARTKATYLVYFGNPDAKQPTYDTDLSVSGEGYALEVENAHYRAVLSSMNGHWKSLYPKQGQAEFVGAGPPMNGGHGVDGTIHWGPDWSDERVGRYRLTSWDGPPMFDYDVVRGPLCVRVRRWGHPILSIGPEVGRPHKVMATVTYTFWSGQPYVLMESNLEVLEDVRFRDCRNDEFVVGSDLDEAAWMGPDGKIGFGQRGWTRQDPRWMTYFNRGTGEGFGSIHLAFENTNPNWAEPASVGFANTGIWVRYPVKHANMLAGDHVYERNAYVLHRFEENGEQSGFADLVGHQSRLLHPVTQAETPPLKKAVTVDNVMDALRATNEFELYVQGSPWGPRQLSFVDIGVVRHVSVDGKDVRVDLVMPFAGRQTWFGWFTQRIEEQCRSRLQDVGRVDVHLVHEPAWTPQQMTDRARRTIGPSHD